MKKIFWRVFVYFGLVLLLFSVLIGLMFTRFNSTNIVGAYKQQLGDLATGVASRTSKAVSNKENDTFSDYLAAVEDFSDMQNVDIWVVSNEKAKNPLADDFTNVDIAQVTVPEDTRQILESAYQGKKKTYTDYDDIYKNTMLHLAVPIRDAGGNVIGAVVVTGPMEMQENTMTQYEKYMVLCVAVGLFLTLILAVVFSRMLVRPIIKIKEAALVLAAGEYGKKTGVTRRDELGSLAESMDTLSDRLVEVEEYQKAVEQNRRDFFSNVSHELRTPIAVVKGYVDTMADGVVTDEEKKKEFLGRIQRECNGMERLVSDLLILSRMQNPDYQLEMEVLNVIAVAQDAMRGIRILMAEKQMQGSVDFEDACSLIKGDYDRIRQVFTILLQNAVKYGEKGTEIHVYIKRQEHTIIAEVTDHGSVIPEEEWDQVFEKFYRASNHGGKEGSGLGLVVANNIIKRHGGRISVTSSEEAGTCFRIELPETSENMS